MNAQVMVLTMAAMLMATGVFGQHAPAPEAPAQAATMAQPAAGEDDDDKAETAAAPVGAPAPVGTAAPAAAAAAQHHDYGPSGIMVRTNREDLAPLTLASGQPVAAAPYTLQSGGYYRIDITADGSAELGLSGGDFFRAIWINEIVVNGIEIRPMGVHSLEFDKPGTATISFVAIQPGQYALSVPGSTGETQRAMFTIR